jgi:hypothetical protein
MLAGSAREILAMEILAVALAERARNEAGNGFGRPSCSHRRSSGKLTSKCALRWSILMAGCQLLKARVFR